MDKQQLVDKTEVYVRNLLESEGSGHDWWHIYRVKEMSLRLAREEGADSFVCVMAALLHDLADEKVTGDEQKGKELVEGWLRKLQLDQYTAGHIIQIIGTLSYRGGGGPRMETIEGMVVQDADRLDAIGAIGIARAFVFSGSKGQIIHDPDKHPNVDMSAEEYKKRETTAINHFYEKLLKLKGLMNTKRGRELAGQRHRFMLKYLDVFYGEWDGKA